MKTTKQKEAILSAVFAMTNHPTADEIYASLKKDNSKLSLGTVYRNLNIFAEKGEIRKVVVPGLSDRFDFETHPHEHFCCQSCGKVFDINADVSIVPKDGDIEITGHTLMLYGICTGCSASTVQ